MSIKKLNESIDNLLNEVEISKVGIKPTFEEELRKSLKETLDYCIRNDRSLYGIADSFADRVESMVPDKRWWEVTDCDFYTEMFNTGDFDSVINCIIDELKPEYKQNVNESYNPEPDEANYGALDENKIIEWLGDHEQAWEDFTADFSEYDINQLSDDEIIGWIYEHELLFEDFCNKFPDIAKAWLRRSSNILTSVDESLDVDDDEYYVGDDETGRIYYGKSSALKAFNELKADGIDAVMNKIEDDSINDLKETYEEPELLGKGYAAPTSMDYVSNIKRLVKNKVTDFTDIQNLMQKTMDNIDAFDNYWKVHKAAIMKNIKEAQDLIPTEYRI